MAEIRSFVDGRIESGIFVSVYYVDDLQKEKNGISFRVRSSQDQVGLKKLNPIKYLSNFSNHLTV